MNYDIQLSKPTPSQVVSNIRMTVSVCSEQQLIFCPVIFVDILWYVFWWRIRDGKIPEPILAILEKD